MVPGLWFALSWVDPESKWFLAVQAARLSLAGLFTGAVRYGVTCFCGVFAYQILENSHLGSRVGNRANLLAALLVAAAIAFHTGGQ